MTMNKKTRKRMIRGMAADRQDDELVTKTTMKATQTISNSITSPVTSSFNSIMLRTSSQAISRSLLQTARSSPAKRSTSIRQSSSGGGGGGSGGGKVVVGLGLTGAAAVGGGIAHAGIDNDFRRLAEETVPGASSVFSAVLGDPESPKKAPVPKKPAELNITSTPPSKKRPIKVEVPEEKKENVILSAPPPPLEKPAFASDSKADDKPVKKEEKKPVTASKEEPPKPKEEPKKPEEPKKAEEPKKDVVKEKEEPSITLPEDEEAVIAREKEMHRKVIMVREKMEEEMVRQLKRQAEAHTDHLNDALELQKKELSRAYLRELDQALEKASVSQREELAAIMGHLRGLQAGLESRAEMDRASLEAQELWLACSAIAAALNDEESSGARSLAKELAAIKRVLADQTTADAYVKAVVSGIPAEAATIGVSTAGDIKERFLKVESLAKKTALVGEEGGSLLTYALSHLQSLFVLSPSTEDMPAKTAAVDLDSLNTFEVVWLAKASLDRGDLEQAVKYVSLLKGQPRNVAQDWLRDARIHLETKQASQALILHAAAIGVEALPQRKKEN